MAGTTKARARVTLAGSIIACVALGLMLLVIGVFDEEASSSARTGGTGEVGGGRWGVPWCWASVCKCVWQVGTSQRA
jgi:hypothetical protein